MHHLKNSAGIYRIVVGRGDRPPKYYIGQAVKFKSRWSQHLRCLRRGSHNNHQLQRAFVKYGPQSISFQILLVCPKQKEMLAMYEQLVLDSYAPKSIYNIHRECVTSPLGRIVSAETRAKIAAAVAGTKWSPEARERKSEQVKRQMADPARRISIAEATRRVMADPEARAKISKTLSARALSPEGLARAREMAAGRVGTKKTPEQIARQVATFKANYVPRPGRKLGADEIARRQASRAANRAAQGLDRY